jgi:hypothetical protein
MFLPGLPLHTMDKQVPDQVSKGLESVPRVGAVPFPPRVGLE